MIVAESKIQGLSLKKVVRYWDERGDFRELVRASDPKFQGFAQLSTSVVYSGISKAWHLHHDQTESMTSVLGVVKFAFSDRRPDSPTFKVTEDYLVDATLNPLVFTVPAGVAHGYRVIAGPAVICYLTNRVYDPADQLKIPHDDPDINYDWGPPKIV
jgi:dTDP-4-dehydrorhamnose 3,5-epimerase